MESFSIDAEPTATILGGPDLYVDKGSTINLTCTIRFGPEPPGSIFWYHENKVSDCFKLEKVIFLLFSYIYLYTRGTIFVSIIVGIIE